MPLLPEMPVLGLLLVPPAELPPPSTPRDPAPTFVDPPGLLFAKLWLPLAKPPLLEAAVPPPVPAAWPDAAFAPPLAPLTAPAGDLLLAAAPPPVPEDLAEVAYGAG